MTAPDDELQKFVNALFGHRTELDPKPNPKLEGYVPREGQYVPPPVDRDAELRDFIEHLFAWPS